MTNRITDIQKRLGRYSASGLQENIFAYLKIADLFFRMYCLYFMLMEHEAMKVSEDYGFVKKEFQTLLMDNQVAII